MSVQLWIKKNRYFGHLHHNLKLYTLSPQKVCRQVCLLRKIEPYIHSPTTGLLYLNQTKIMQKQNCVILCREAG